jgi:1,4-alpha-glucan branching enzyme
MGFTHIEFLPISEHPFDPSWGYQTTGLYAPTARFGAAGGLRALRRRRACGPGIGVILDWVPAHFPTDAHGLAMFDGTALYEHADPRQGFHPDWNTAIYNFGRARCRASSSTTRSTGGAFHVDGLRVDAVASMLYLDYSRRPASGCQRARRAREPRGGRLPAGDEREVYGSHPGIMTIAEESTSWPG